MLSKRMMTTTKDLGMRLSPAGAVRANASTYSGYSQRFQHRQALFCKIGRLLRKLIQIFLRRFQRICHL